MGQTATLVEEGEMARGESWTDERLDDLNATVDRRFGEVDRRFGEVDRRFEQVDQRFDRLEDGMEKQFERIDGRFEHIEGKLDRLFYALLTSMGTVVAALIVKVFAD